MSRRGRIDFASPRQIGCQRVVCQSRILRGLLLSQRQLLRCRCQQIVVVPNGVDLRRFDPSRFNSNRCRKALGLKPDHFVVGAVARLAPQKNIDHLLRAAQMLIQNANSDWPRIRIIIAGRDGGSKKELVAQAARLDIARDVGFIGSRSDVPQMLRALHVFAMSSFHEGSPFALLEAMAMWLPIVASQVGSIPEIIDGNGYLICVLELKETFHALRDLMANQTLRAYGWRSRTLSARYDVDGMVRGYEPALLDAIRLSRPERRRKAGRRRTT